MLLFLRSILFLNIFASSVAHAQDATSFFTYTAVITGNGKPVVAATVLLGNKAQAAVSDTNGMVVFSKVKPGIHRLHFSAIGFQHRVVEVSIPQPSVPDTIQVSAALNTLEDVVISGTMKPISKMDSPIPVEVYTPALFKKNPAPNIFESLQMVNGVQPQLNCNVCNTGDIHINGMEGPYTMILIDGMPIVSSLSTVYGLSGIPNSLIKRVEIVKGPASTLYGSEAVGGLINIITRDPLNADRFKADVSATSIGEYNVDLTAAYKTKFATAIAGLNYFNFNNRRDINNDNFTDVTLQNRVSFFNKYAFNRASKRSATLAFRYVFENRWGGELQWNSAFKGTDSIYGETIRTNRVELIGNYQLAENVYADLSYNYHLQDSYYGTTKYYAQQHVAFGQVRWNRSYQGHDLLVGLPIRFTQYDDNSPATAKNGLNNPSRIFLPGLFVQDEIKASTTITTLLGLRYDYNNEHGSIVTPRLAIKYAPNKNNTVRLSGGNGYRVVNLFTEDHAALTGAREVVIAEALKPEQSWNANLNYTTLIKLGASNITLDASAFLTRFSNKIVGDFITDPQKIIYENLRGHAISKGFTLNTDVSVNHRIKANAGITLMEVYQVDKDNRGEMIKVPQLFAPRFSGTYALSYSIPAKSLSFDWTGKVNGPMHLPVVPNDFRPAKSPMFCIMNLQATKTFINGLEIYGGIKNILNFLPKNPLLHPDDPFNKPGGKYFDNNGNARADTNPNGYFFDPSYNYAPVQGAKGFLGVRWTMR